MICCSYVYRKHLRQNTNPLSAGTRKGRESLLDTHSWQKCLKGKDVLASLFTKVTTYICTVSGHNYSPLCDVAV